MKEVHTCDAENRTLSFHLKESSRQPTEFIPLNDNFMKAYQK